MRSPSQSVRFACFDVASTLLEKRDLSQTITAVLPRAGYVLPVAMVKERRNILTEVLPFADRADHGFYDDFNARLRFALCVVPTAALFADCYASCRALPWAAFDDAVLLDRFDTFFAYAAPRIKRLWELVS